MNRPIIDPEFHALIPPLSPDELSQLEANIKADGCRDALVVWGHQGIILDGHNRFEICERLKIPYQTKNIYGQVIDRDGAKEWIIRNQFGRRNISIYQRAELALILEPIIAAKAKEKQREAGGAVPQKSAKPPIDTRENLASIAGVSHDTIHKAKIISARADDETKARLRSGDTSINAEYKKIEKHDRGEKLKDDIAHQVKVSPSGPPVVDKSDAVEWLKRQPMADMILTDPPYMTDVDDIESFAASWLTIALSKLKSTGRAYVTIGAYPREIAAYLKVAMPDQILVWTYRNTLGPSPKENYKLNWQAILYFKGADAPPLDCPIMIEQFSVQDINAPDGRLGDRFHSWQKPIELAERFIRHSTKQGDLILDPFCCTGSFLLAGAKLGRMARGCDINPEFLKIAIERGCAYAK